MPRDTIPVVNALVHAVANLTTGDGVAISATNGAVVTPTKRASQLLLKFSNTITNATKVVTIKAGDNPPAANAAQGDVSLTVPASGEIVVAVESARVLQNDGTINVDFGSGMTGFAWAVQLPAGAA
jgi:hypothetical protein